MHVNREGGWEVGVGWGGVGWGGEHERSRKEY